MPDTREERLIASRDLAVAALEEVTSAASIGAPLGHRVEEDGVVSLLFSTRLEGYPGWQWTVTLAEVDDAEPTVLEVHLLPGDGALLAPEWVPWAVRLAEYRAQQAARAADESAEHDDADLDDADLDDTDLDDADDEDDIDELDLDESGDVDGVDIDDLADHDDEDDSADDDEDASDAIEDDSRA